MTLEEEITALTAKWYKYVNIDHHKDRDCHWYIQKMWSYGDEPYYQAFHHGYVLEGWSSPKCSTEEMAQTIVRDKLKREIDHAISHLTDTMEHEEALDWLNKSKEDLQTLIKELQ
jgi:hypothetical protein